jgi:hypothetical protein
MNSPYYSESEPCGGAVTVSFSKYLPWQAMHFLQRSTHFSKTCCTQLITSKFLASELPFRGWKILQIAWDEIWIEFCFRRRLGIFLFNTASRTALGPTQPPINWVPGALSWGWSGRGVKLTIHLHLVPRSKNEWSYTSTPPIRLHGVVFSSSTGITLTFPIFGLEKVDRWNPTRTSAIQPSHRCK